MLSFDRLQKVILPLFARGKVLAFRLDEELDDNCLALIVMIEEQEEADLRRDWLRG
ncbi:MAG TPA: hypothetical protein VFK28_04270 [Sphingomicrobium sp.]|nr:hypothetical protein [Sphingomicrobium sp.]